MPRGSLHPNHIPNPHRSVFPESSPGPTRQYLINEYLTEPMRRQMGLVLAQAAEAFRHGRVEPLASLERAAIAADLVGALLVEFEMMGTR